jgi:Fe-S-cluster-containing dehydrogenase component
MDVTRRTALKVAAFGAAVATGARRAEARERKEAPPDATGMLYDSTLCIGCKACVVACREANGLPYEPHSRLYDDPIDLTANTCNIIKLVPEEGGGPAFMKAQCMHCIDPACASACMMHSFEKRQNGIVTWKPEKCIGCRYCQVACPFNIPKFQWGSANPAMVKCQMCLAKAGTTEPGQLNEVGQPACTEVCPRHAVIYGKYTDLVEEAKRRIAESPERYEDHVYGLEEGGGTQVLYLTARGVPFTKLGLPDLGRESVPSKPVGLQHTLYKGFVAPVVLYGVLAGLVRRSRNKQDAASGEAKEVTK